jgi:hypothetical protein
VVCRVALILLMLAMALPAQAQNLSTSSAPLRDVAYTFDLKKLNAAKDSFDFFRSFVDYFYLVAKANESALSILQPPAKTSFPTAVCVGDAHLENFGFLLQKSGQTLFTSNDIDDSEVAPAVVELFRFLVSARIYDSSVSIDELLDAYTDGVSNIARRPPQVVDEMLAKSRSNSTAPSKNDVKNERFIQPSEARRLEVQELKDVSAEMQKLSGRWKIVDTYAIKKISGGSGGMLRYEVLLKGTKGRLLHIELKEETVSSLAPFVSSPLTIESRILRALDATLDSSIDSHYRVVTIIGRQMLVRPRYSAHVGVNLDKNSRAENRELMTYEAFTLGKLHLRTISDASEWLRLLKAASRTDWENDVKAMVLFNEQKFRSRP